MSLEIGNTADNAFLEISRGKPGHVKIESMFVSSFGDEELMFTEVLGEFAIRDLLIALKAYTPEPEPELARRPVSRFFGRKD